MSDDTEIRDKRFTLRGWHVVLVLLVVLAGLIGLQVVLRKSSTERRLKALHAAGYPTNFVELAECTKLPEGVENAAEMYTRAFAAYVPPVEEANVPLLGRAKLPDRGAPLPDATAQAISKCLADNQACLALLHEAAGLEHCRYPTDYRQPLPQATEWRRCAQLLRLAATHHARRGDTAGATACIKDGLRLSDSLRREPMLIGYLMRTAGISVALGGLEHSLNVTAFKEEQLTELSAALTRTGSLLDFTAAMITERCFMIETWRDPSLLGPSGLSLPVRLVPGMKGAWLTDILDTMEQRVEASKLPPIERLKRFRRMDDEVKQLSFLHVMIKIVMPAMTRVAELDVRVRAHLELAKTALALERYRLATGKLPEKLEELAPQYLAQVPFDPFDAQPIRYQRTGPGYLLYSVDTDGRDNGGRERSEKDRDAPYDWCFIVTR